MSKFLVLTTQSNHTELLEGFKLLHIYNVAILSSTKLTILNPFKGNSEIQRPSQNLSSILFPDKFSDISKHELKVPVTAQTPQVVAFAIFGIKKVMSKYTYFIDIVKNKMNAEIDYNVLDFEELTTVSYYNMRSQAFKELRNNLKVDLTINDAFQIYDNAPKFMTYEILDICAYCFFPPKIPIYDQILTMPFERQIWMVLAFSMFSCSVVWRLYRFIGASDSYGHFLFGAFGFFLGQSTNFKR